MFLDGILKETDNYINTKTKADRKKIGQFFTSKETAIFMAKLSKVKSRKIKILDAGAGSGILALALLEYIEKNNNIEEIEIDLYENDNDILTVLKDNMKKAKEHFIKLKKYNIFEENFITYNENSESNIYDIIISNPPYKKLGKNDIESKIMPEVIHGQPNIYFLFMAMAMKLLKENGEMIFIVPRSWTSGTYFKKFREKFLDTMKLTNIHLFVSRDKVFNKEKVLQETIILRAEKTHNEIEKIEISQTYSNDDFNKITRFNIDYNVCVEKDNEKYVYLPVNDEDIHVIEFINKFKYTLTDIGLKLKTGLTVDFRNKEYLEKKPNDKNVPLLSSIHFKNGIINFPSNNDDLQYINKNKTSLLQKNTNYLFIKRFTSKEEKRRIQPAMFFKEDYKDYDYISTENHINFIDKIDDGKIDNNLIYGLYGIYNSTIYDKYYRILNGSTQVNANEINNIPIPNEKILTEIGRKIANENSRTTQICDSILMEVVNNG